MGGTAGIGIRWLVAIAYGGAGLANKATGGSGGARATGAGTPEPRAAPPPPEGRRSEHATTPARAGWSRGAWYDIWSRR